MQLIIISKISTFVHPSPPPPAFPLLFQNEKEERQDWGLLGGILYFELY